MSSNITTVNNRLEWCSGDETCHSYTDNKVNRQKKSFGSSLESGRSVLALELNLQGHMTAVPVPKTIKK